MKDSISVLVKNFTEFLSKNKATLKENRNSLISFAVQVHNLDLTNKLNYLIKHHETSFYFEKPSDDFLVFGFDEILSISENGDKRFTSTEKKVNDLKNDFFNNWKEFEENFPLFVGSMKFNVEHPDEDWNDFNDSNWFIPELMFFSSNKKKFLIFNFYYNFPYENLISKFKIKIESLFNLKTETNNEKVNVVNISGNTIKDKKKWKNLVNTALEKIYEHEINKIVIARRIDVQLSDELNFDNVFENLREKYTGCYLFSLHKGKSTFFGATPEKLAKFSNGEIEIEALAGSAPRGVNEKEDLLFKQNLLKSEKDLNEHNFVIEHIKNYLSNIAEEIEIQESPVIKELNNILHLNTTIKAKMNPEKIPFGALKELFPTPAVCGLPKEVSLHLIKKLETHNRGLYSGIIGWFNFEDQGEFAVSIRSALTYKKKLIAYAGSGIVEKSEPDLEFEETELKFKPILSLLNEN